MTEAPRLLIIGAHPDDAEFHAGGLAALYRRADFAVKMVSVTDGRAGHQSLPSEDLVRIRREEAAAAAAVIGAESEVWDFPDGELLPTLDVRRAVIAAIREYRADLVLTHRTCDYHPDHRAVGQAVQDASYMVTVPKVAPHSPALRQDPVVGYLPDLFTRPAPLRPDVIVPIAETLDSILDMLAAHRSQFFDWLPYNLRILDQLPADEAGRRAWLAAWYGEVVDRRSAACKRALASAEQKENAPPLAGTLDQVEMFEISEYARPLDAAQRERLFPFAV